MLFSEYQAKAHETATTNDIDVYMLGLIGEAGSVASTIKKFKRDAPSQQQVKREIQEELGDALWYLTEIASRFDLDLDTIAIENTKKTAFLFKGQSGEFDAKFPPDEQFPRLLEVRWDASGPRVLLTSDNQSVGDPLTDKGRSSYAESTIVGPRGVAP